ncbi:unnamed protein product [Onchocerca flexuosa]|uniref:Membrane-associated kinase regulator 6 n=1 Tax=Onchocerca flexuosa TaxID=387005 RepID=A0A183H2Y9_9BILA|nr:unnamed protein product [Onchocerca flexuosa]
MLFSKFVRNTKLERFMDQAYNATLQTHHSATQTDITYAANTAIFEEQIHFLRGSRVSSSISCRSTYSPSNAFDAESILSDAFGDIEFTEACALFATTNDSNSICASVASGHLAQLPVKKQLDSVLKQKPKLKKISRCLRTTSCHATISSHSNESSTTALFPPLSNAQLSRNRSYCQIRSLPSSFQRSSLQSIPSLFSRKWSDEL